MALKIPPDVHSASRGIFSIVRFLRTCSQRRGCFLLAQLSNHGKIFVVFAVPEVVLRACYMSGLSFSGFTEVYKPSLLKHYVEAIVKYC